MRYHVLDIFILYDIVHVHVYKICISRSARTRDIDHLIILMTFLDYYHKHIPLKIRYNIEGHHVTSMERMD